MIYSYCTAKLAHMNKVWSGTQWTLMMMGVAVVGVAVVGVAVLCYLPLPMEGNATDLSFFSSARARQFFTVLSSSSSHLSEPQPGLLQWITNFAGRP